MGTTILVLLEINGFIRPENRNLCVSASLILSKKNKVEQLQSNGGGTAADTALHSAEMLSSPQS